MAGLKRKKSKDSPLTSKTVSKIKLMSQPEILKFQQDIESEDNPEIEECILKLTESGVDYLKGFCQLNKAIVRGETISDIVTALIQESLVDEHIQIRFCSDQEEKNYLLKEVNAYKSAKLEEIIETKSELVNVGYPTEDTKLNL